MQDFLPGVPTRVTVLGHPASQKAYPLALRHVFSVVESILPSLLIAHPHTVDWPLVPVTEGLQLSTPSLFPEPGPHLPLGSQQLWIAEGLLIVGRAGQILKEITSLGREVRLALPQGTHHDNLAGAGLWAGTGWEHWFLQALKYNGRVVGTGPVASPGVLHCKANHRNRGVISRPSVAGFP